jgi:type II secretory pathway pseudopilin PulG
MIKDETRKPIAGKKVLTLIVVLMIVGLLAAGGYYFMQYRNENKQKVALQSQNAELNKVLGAYKADPNQAAQAEADKTIAEVGKLYALPKDEKPSVATVKDKSKLADQPFFAKAENGDVTLIYSTAKLAILYRPSSKQIINVSSVTIQDQPAAANPAP